MYNTVIEQVINAGLSRSVESLVLRLLHVVDGETGQVALLMDDFLHLTGVKTKNAAMRYLSSLKQAGIIRYHTNAYRIDAQVFVAFRAWQVEDEDKVEDQAEAEGLQELYGEIRVLRGQMAEVLGLLARCDGLDSARMVVETNEMDAPFSTAERADFAHPNNQPTDQTLKPPRKVGLLVGLDPEIPKPTNQSTQPQRAESSAQNRCVALSEVRCTCERISCESDGAQGDGTEDATHFPSAMHRGEGGTQISQMDADLEEQGWIYKLLTDPEIGVSGWKARSIAQQHRFDYVRRQLFAWETEMAIDKVDGVGALVHRIEARFGAGEPTAEQKESALYLRHRTPFEIEAEVKAKAEEEAKVKAMRAKREAAQSQPQSKPQSQPVDPTLWPQVMAQLKMEFPSMTYDVFLKSAQLLGVEDGVYRIGVASNFLRENVNQHYRGVIRRTLGGLVGDYQVPIRIEVAPNGGG